jgi:hypothetical protein
MRDMGFLQGSTNSPRQVREGKGREGEVVGARDTTGCGEVAWPDQD